MSPNPAVHLAVMSNSQNSNLNYWALIPAAGVGKRMGSDKPKQFQMIGKQSVLEHSIQALSNVERLQRLVIVSDATAEVTALIDRDNDAILRRVDGGAERCHSVLNGLQSLAQQANDDDWILVHDAARPCVRIDDIKKLVQQLNDTAVGGVLGVPVHDTMKRTTADDFVQKTEPREHLWHAQTPQMFRYGLLKAALQQAISDGFEVTDESSAMEHAGHHPLMVEGHADNIKITRPEDLQLAEYYLHQQGRL